MFVIPAAAAALLQLAVAQGPHALPADTTPPATAQVASTQAAAPAAQASAPQTAAPAALPGSVDGPLGPRRMAERFDAASAWALEPMPADTPQPRGRTRAITHSDAYYTRLTIHRIASFAILPLFAGEWIVGQKVMNEEPQRSSARGAHAVLGAGIFAAFGANTITGVWNLIEARHDPGAARRTTHVLLMLAADAGFAATAATVPHGSRLGTFRTGPTQSAMNRHRDIAIGSIAVGTIGSLMMWLWK